MSGQYLWGSFQVLVGLSLLTGLAGCGGNSPEDEDVNHEGHAHSHTEGGGHDHGHDGGGGAEFDEESGLLVHEEARAQIGLRTAVVGKQTLALQFTATAQVFERSRSEKNEVPTVRASAIILELNAEFLKEGDMVEVRLAAVADSAVKGRLVRLDKQTARAIGQVEAIIEVLDSRDRMHLGSFLDVTFRGEEQEVLAVPGSAVLDAATGTFAYVKNGERFIRKPIKVGASRSGFVEIVEGLSPGEEVVDRGVVGLWLMELRFTKGGGHSH